MVRIIGEEKPQHQRELPRLTQSSNVLLQVIGFIIADNPNAIKNLLEEYSIELPEDPGEKVLTDKLLFAIGEGNKEFNNELASLILDFTLESDYDIFNFKSMFSRENENASFSGEGVAGLVGGISSAIGSIGNVVGQGIQRKQAKEQATTQTLQGIYAHKAQLAFNEQNNSSTKMYLLIGFFVLLGFGLVALAAYIRKKSHQPTPLIA